MSRVSEIVSSKIGNTITNAQTWGGVIYNVKAYDAAGNGTTNDTSAIQSAIDACEDDGGGMVWLPPGIYLITSLLSIPSDVNVFIDIGATIKNVTTGNNGIFSIAAGESDITIFGKGTLLGPYESTTPAPTGTYPGGNGAIRINGTVSSPCYRIHVLGLTIKGWGDYGVFAENVIDSSFEDNDVSKCGRDGFRFYGAIDTNCNSNVIDNIAPGFGGSSPNLNVYGITFTRRADAGLATNPRSERCQAMHNRVSNCNTWKGIDTHGGKDIKIAHNVINGAYIAIGVDEGDTTGETGDAPAEGVSIIDNTMILGGGNTNGAGINVGSTGFSFPARDIKISSNTIMGGFGGTSLGGAVCINYAEGVDISHNYIEDANRCAITFRTECRGARVSENIIRDLTGTILAAIATETEDIDLDIASGTFIRSTGGFTAFSFTAVSTFGISLGTNFRYVGTITKFAASARSRVSEGGFMQSAKAWGRITSAGAKSGTCYGISTASKTGTGVYRITLSEAFASTNNMVPVATIETTSSADATAVPASTTEIDVYTFVGGAATDSNFKLALFGV